ncbi:TRAP-type C4-dicarboxylate transport system, substrate-binding protein [Paracoccus isoporae]|uniref:TRAP-type C4-dicarboxylate transport system, substrate-binding protein n=1 Tax=Paracoccus isoporae TaxID=591205 RepID=A0A1G6WTP2_9RHOB|nr:TRAP transporter substrate-binding protein DctP [Paracoccus isoporae]SDD68405.1 TRAP-type C4-dicarboxylate transport system, substrate-binding protein [Paracoccus isoporae]
MKITMAASLMGTAMLVATAAQAQDETFDWTLAYLSVKGTIYEEVALAIPERISAATDGRVTITANSSLVAGDRLLESVRDGLVQMSMPLTGYYTGSQPMFTVPSLPGYSESYDDLKALSESDYGEQVRAIYNDDYTATEIMETAFCPQTLFSTAPITTLEEWEGKKLRVNNRGTGLIGGELGAITVSLSAAEVLPALERGVIDGVITDTCWAYGAGFGSVITHGADWQLGKVVPSPVLVNNDAWNELPEDLRETIAAEFAAIEADFETRWRERTGELPGLWAEAGVDYTVVSDEENARFNADDLQSQVIEAWREDMARAGHDADAVLETAKAAIGKE